MGSLCVAKLDCLDVLETALTHGSSVPASWISIAAIQGFQSRRRAQQEEHLWAQSYERELGILIPYQYMGTV
jgi:hypothetical protein